MMNNQPQFGKYRTIRPLGDGGMAKVYLALDPNGARVVIKVPHREFASDAQFIRRLKAEKDAFCRLNHPCIAVFKDFHEDWEPPVLVMEYVDGHPLGRLLAEASGPWPLARSCLILVQIAEALAYCHKAGVVHRDVKPPNVMITEGDHVKVLDFGIARLRDAPALTHRTKIVGSPHVMAPEQWQKMPVTDKVDIYALGVIAYRMITGRYPFEGDIETLQDAHIAQHPVPPRSLNPDMPPALSDLVMECLNKDPRLRLSSADEFLRRMEKIRDTLSFYERYRLEEEIGRGAMGVVFRATRRTDGMTVAIKTLDQRLTDPVLLGRLKAEADVLARLQHPFICQLIEAKENFMVMQYIRGETLSDRIRKSGGLPVDEALRYFKDILKAIAAAHRENVIHRDLKPSNIMITDDPIEKNAIVMDFGIAKIVGSSAATRTAEGFGAVPYKAPELWKKRPPDAKSDIYALGVMLYEMLTNALPFSGPDPGDYERQHLSEQPSDLTEHGVDVDQALSRLVTQCLEKDPDRRFGSSEEIFRELGAIGLATNTEITGAINVKPPPQRPTDSTIPGATVIAPVKRRAPVRLLAAVMALLVVAAYIFWPKSTPEHPAEDGDSITMSAPKLVMPTQIELTRGQSESFTVSVPAAADDPTLTVRAVPDAGFTFTPAADGTFDAVFTPFPECPDDYRPAIVAAGIGGRDSQIVAIRLIEQTPAVSTPQLSLTTDHRIPRGAPLAVAVSVSTGPTADPTLQLSAEPGRGVRFTRVDSANHEFTFTPFPGCPDPYAFSVIAEGQAGSARRTVTVDFIDTTDRHVWLSISPPGHVLVNGRARTSRPVGEFDAMLPPGVRRLTIMTPGHPLYSVPLEDDGGPIVDTIDFARSFANRDTVILLANVVGIELAGSDASSTPILVNGVPYPGRLKQRWLLIQGDYRITTTLGAESVDSIRFNDTRFSAQTEVFHLRSPGDGFRFNRFLVYAH